MKWRSALTRLNPFAALFGPVFDKEVRTLGRVRGTYIARFLYPALLIIPMTIAWIALTQQREYLSQAGRIQTTSNLAPLMTIVFGWAQLALLSLLAPTLTAPSLCDERRKRTLPSLATTPLTTIQIVFGKLAGRMLQILILASVAAPLLLMLRIYGGLEAGPVIAVMALSVATALFAGSLGLFFGLWRQRPTGAIGMAHFILLFYLVAPAPLYFLLARLGIRIPEDAYAMVLAHLNPVVAMGLVMAETLEGASPIARSTTPIWATCAGVMASLSLVTGLLTAAMMRRVMLAEAAGARPRADRRRRRSLRRAAGYEVASPARTRSSRVVGENPVFWREARARFLQSRKGSWAAGLLILAALGTLYYTADPEGEALHLSLTVVIAIVQLLLACQWTARAIAGERESRTWDALLTTRLSARRILYGKWLGGALRLAPLPLFLLGHYVVFGALGYTHMMAGLLTFAILAGFTLLLTATGLRFSLTMKRSAAAGVANTAIAIAFWLILPIALPMTVEPLNLADSMNMGRFILSVVAAINPVYWCAMIAIWAARQAFLTDGAFALAQRPQEFEPFGSFTPPEVVIWTLVVALAAALLGLIVNELTVQAFRKRGGRAS